MKTKTSFKRANTKRQNGSKNPIFGKEFTPNGYGWVFEGTNQLGIIFY